MKVVIKKIMEEAMSVSELYYVMVLSSFVISVQMSIGV